jgi:multidrug efflux system membrane fusion protein
MHTPTLQQFFRYLLLLATIAASLIGCSKSSDPKSGGRGSLKYAVEIAPVVTRSVDFTVKAVGSVEAFEIVPLTARVQGVVEAVRFREGDIVSKGDALVDIEPARYQLGVESAEALLNKSSASLREAQAGLKRRAEIFEKQIGMISPEEMEDWQTRVKTLEADSAYAHSALEVARLNQRDSRVPAPVSGIIQDRKVSTGQYVQAGTVIATLVRRDPLLLRFNVPEQDAQRMSKGIPIRFTMRDDTREYTAEITAITESADLVTRMVTVTAQVTDEQRERLRPGSFAEVVVMLGESAVLPVVPQTSIRPSERGFLAFVVEDSTAQERVLTLGMRSADGLVEVRNGIQAGEKVVVRGAEALTDGAKVRVEKVSEILPDTAKGSES